ncbi:MAG: PilZ domain-containing protein [Pseudomonadota bacterium]
MGSIDKRINKRLDSLNLLSYVCCDDQNTAITQGMGRTLNVSEGGIRIETRLPMDTQWLVSLTVALEDDLMDFKGKVVHSVKREDGNFEYGIEFTAMDEGKRVFLKQYILLFRDQ